jgi:hypothetical protein
MFRLGFSTSVEGGNGEFRTDRFTTDRSLISSMNRIDYTLTKTTLKGVITMKTKTILKAVLVTLALATLGACAEAPEWCHDCDDKNPATSSIRHPDAPKKPIKMITQD